MPFLRDKLLNHLNQVLNKILTNVFRKESISLSLPSIQSFLSLKTSKSSTAIVYVFQLKSFIASIKRQISPEFINHLKNELLYNVATNDDMIQSITYTLDHIHVLINPSYFIQETLNESLLYPVPMHKDQAISKSQCKIRFDIPKLGCELEPKHIRSFLNTIFIKNLLLYSGYASVELCPNIGIWDRETTQRAFSVHEEQENMLQGIYNRDPRILSIFTTYLKSHVENTRQVLSKFTQECISWEKTYSLECINNDQVVEMLESFDIPISVVNNDTDIQLDLTSESLGKPWLIQHGIPTPLLAELITCKNSNVFFIYECNQSYLRDVMVYLNVKYKLGLYFTFYLYGNCYPESTLQSNDPHEWITKAMEWFYKICKQEDENASQTSFICSQNALVMPILSIKRLSDLRFEVNEWIENDFNIGIYISYCHARLVSIANKSGLSIGDIHELNAYVHGKDAQKQIETEEIDWNILYSTVGVAHLCALISEYPQILESSLNRMDSSILLCFLLKLSKTFSSSSFNLRVKNIETRVGRARLLILECCKRILQHGILMLGLKPIETM